MEIAVEGFVAILGSSIFGNLFSAAGLILAVIASFFVVYKRWITRDNLKNIGAAFNETVKGLAADKIEDRMSSAIVLRRFLDARTEYGVGGTPFAKTAVSVISAVLKHSSTSDFQKVLADSLAYAPEQCLVKGDFQRANLSKAYLGGAQLEGADFYQANLSGASLSKAKLSGATFREATLNRTVFKEASLRGANFSLATLQSVNFSYADLTDAKFDGATLREVDFTGAKLEGAIFINATGYGNIGSSLEIGTATQAAKTKRIFISRPGELDSRQTLFVESIKAILKIKGFDYVELERDCYDSVNVLNNLHRKISESSAMIAFGFQSIIINDGLFRLSTNDSRKLSNVHLSTPWNHVEIAMAVGLQMHVLALTDDTIEDGVFGNNINDRLLTKQKIESSLNYQSSSLNAWLDSLEDPKDPIRLHPAD